MKKLLVITVIVLFIGTSLLPSINGNFNKMTKTNNPAYFDDNLIGCWHFDEGSGNIAYDSSGHNNNGTIYGASWVGGILDNALWFDGNDDYVRVFNTSDFEFINQSFTFLTWVKIYDNTNNNRFFISLGDTDGPPVTNLGKCRSGYNDGKIVLSMTNNEYEQTTCSSVDNGDTLSKNQWMHVAGVANYESNLIKLYIDGNIQENQSIVDLNLSKAQELRLIFGNYTRTDPAYDHHHYGVLDEVYIYNRPLTEEEILEYYQEFYPVETVYVDDDFNSSTPGWGYDHFDKIQYGVNAINESGTVYVYNGTYYENVVVDKTINLKGEDSNSTIIDGGGISDVIYVSVDNVEISNFSITNSGIYGWQNDYDAGIDVRSNKNNFFNNRINSNYLHGFYMRSSSDNKIFSNNISNSYVGMQIVHSCNNNTIKGNKISNIEGSGLRFLESSLNTVDSNIISSSNYSIILEENSNNNSIYLNLLTFSNYYAINIISSSANLIYHNNFIDNYQNTYDDGTNRWHNSALGEGNYYDDYNGTDSDGDGIGDTPYNISGGDNQDLYPLMHPFELYFILDIILDNLEVDEGTEFNVIIKSKGGTTIPNAKVEFNDEQKITGLTGTVHFTAPLVDYNTLYNITATKEGYTNDTETILIKDVPDKFEKCFMFGRIKNLSTGGEYFTFEALKVRVIKFSPFSFNTYISGEKITIQKDFKGLVGALFGIEYVLAWCDAHLE